MRQKPLLGIVGALTIWASLTLHATTGASFAGDRSGGGADSRDAAEVKIASGLEGASGSAVGPDGALYVTEGAAGRIARVDPNTGDVTTFASGLPPSIVGIGGAIDVAFIRRTAYVLVTLVGADVGGGDVVGIYRVDGPSAFTVVADIGAFAIQNPPRTQFDVPTGLQYAMEPYRGGFLVTDGHHNRVLWAALDGTVREVVAFDNIVPTGLAIWGHIALMAEAGPVPHAPEDGKIVAFVPGLPFVVEVASGAPLLVDVEFGPGRTVYALSQGEFPVGGPPAAPAIPNTGVLAKVGGGGRLTVVAGGLNQPTSLEFIGQRAYVVTLTGEVWRIDLRHRGRH
jgi:hypothetical protein